ncbi:ABC transporter ATP-binding protein [Aristaeella lactis]|uniref:ATP-binding cassette, subfamily B n=1 Tax=Aristaeella lactis TaxID=3046383 RepID=A0AC61PKF9_9FIRM|nr:ABC transporter ATP-binding protein [Aristaeella lactis]QUA51936.1 ABC transporter ATP-binding protein [Aristaeella lactis]SMC53734.1 ATP-binding cassette, subfamily B [Aristaeella lactis]
MLKILKEYFDFCNREDRHKFHLAVILGVFRAMFSALRITAVAVVVQGLIEGQLTSRHLWLSFGIMAVSVLGQIMVTLKTTMLQCEAGYHSCCNKRIEIAEHLRYLPMGFFNRNSLGAITNVTTNTMESLADVAARIVMVTTQGILTTSVIAVFVLAFDWRIGLVLVAGILLFLLFNSRMQKATVPLASRKHNADEDLVSQVIEYVQGIAEVKNYSMTDSRAKKLDAAINEKRDTDTAVEFTVMPWVTIQNITTKLTGMVMSILALKFYFDGTMPLLYCIMMMISAFMVFESLEAMGSFSALLRTVHVAVTKTKEIMDMPPMDIDGADITPARRDIELKNVDFSYDRKKIIDNVSLTIPEKTTTAFVGPSGGGKTTLCHLMARFWDVQGGQVLLGGRNVKDYSFDSLMKNFSFVFQNVYLFEDTIANNIRFGEPGASMDRVIEAAKKARCHDFIMALPEGYQTVIGEGGASLSGGEKQRISIARAIMKNAPVIILDEATANVDPESETELTAAIEELTKEKTIIMIAHRLKTVRNADQIFVIDNGKIAQHGTHDELIRKNGIYKTFVEGRQEAASWKIA